MFWLNKMSINIFFYGQALALVEIWHHFLKKKKRKLFEKQGQISYIWSMQIVSRSSIML